MHRTLMRKSLSKIIEIASFHGHVDLGYIKTLSTHAAKKSLVGHILRQKDLKDEFGYWNYDI